MSEQAQDSRLLTAQQVADFLGVSRSHVYHLMQNQRLTHIRIGGSLRVRQSDVENYIAKNTKHHVVLSVD
jgi:excisionase family DNA binding protein